MKFNFIYPLVLLPLFFAGCMKHGPRNTEQIEPAGRRGLFIVNEGNHTYGNASLSYYNIDTKRVENEVFVRRNGFPLGDVAQSMTIHNGVAYIVVNNSSVVFAMNPNTFEYSNEIPDLPSPRCIHVVSEDKAYISDMSVYKISVFNPQTLKLTGSISTDFEDRKRPSTEQMLQHGKYVFTNCWSYDEQILVIDTEKDEVVRSIKTGKQPNSMVLDRNGKIWVLSDGGYEFNPIGHEAPSLRMIDAQTWEVEKIFEFAKGERAADMSINGAGDMLYILKDDIWKMDVDADLFPAEPFISNTTGNYWYGISVDPQSSEIYLADAVDKVQPGVVYRYSTAGKVVDRFKVGIIPGDFCFYFRDDE